MYIVLYCIVSQCTESEETKGIIHVPNEEDVEFLISLPSLSRNIWHAKNADNADTHVTSPINSQRPLLRFSVFLFHIYHVITENGKLIT